MKLLHCHRQHFDRRIYRNLRPVLGHDQADVEDVAKQASVDRAVKRRHLHIA